MKRLTKLVATLGVGMSLALPMVSTSTVLADETTAFEPNNSNVNVQGLFDQKTTVKVAGVEWSIGGSGGTVMDYNNPKAWPGKPWCPRWLSRN